MEFEGPKNKEGLISQTCDLIRDLENTKLNSCGFEVKNELKTLAFLRLMRLKIESSEVGREIYLLPFYSITFVFVLYILDYTNYSL